VFEVNQITDFQQRGRNKNKSYLRFTPDFSRQIEKIEELYTEVTPLHLPVSELNDWTGMYDGGFFDNAVYRRPIMSTYASSQLDAMKASDCAPVYSAINTLQRTKWKVNETLLEVLREAVTAGWLEDSLELPTSEPPTKPEYPGDDVREEGGSDWRHYANAMRQYHRTIQDWDMRRAQYGRLLFLADFYSKREYHCLVHGIDFRGRIYPTTSALNYQGDDVQRALCHFAEALPIETKESADWYLAHGANCYGYDKVSLFRRVRWCVENKSKIQQVYDDPTENRWWTTAEKPWLFLAWCLEAAPFLADPKPGYMSRIPVSVDGSNNGLQIYSLLLRDPVGGKATNITDQDEPSDIYQDVANKTTELLRNAVTTGSDDKDLAESWLNLCSGELPRKATKKVVMTDVYSSTMYSRQHYVSEWYYSIVRNQKLDPPPFPPRSTYKATYFLAQKISEALSLTVSAASSAMSWMRELADEASRQNVHLSWVTPTGLRVKQNYCKSTARTVEVQAQRKVKVYLRDWSDQVERRKSANGFCPNYIHSLDAAAATLTVNQMADQGVKDFMMIHDSFGCHAHFIPHMNRALRNVYRQIFSDDLLAKLKSEVQTTLAPNTQLPDAPKSGSLDVNQLTASTYFFA
jgi:DNA-directed RNA polymerase